jgi:hypothetical protein
MLFRTPALRSRLGWGTVIIAGFERMLEVMMIALHANQHPNRLRREQQ